MYDYLIVGAGLYGSIFAHEANKRGFKCLVIDKRSHIGGNVYTENIEGINVHKYGAHIFHTDNQEVWNYVNSFASFNRYTNSPIAFYKGKLYNLPFNMNTFYQLWGVITPMEAQQIIEQQRAEYIHITEPSNLEEQALVLVGKDVYEKLIKGYTEKQWGRSATKIPPFIIKRIPLRFNFDNNYFFDKYQGIPIGGYTKIFNKLLDEIEVKINTDYFSNRDYFDSLAKKIVYTGKIDEFYNYKFGNLDYRSLRFENELLEKGNFQGNAVVNYTDINIPFTRIIEHKHFEFGTQPVTYVTREYSKECFIGDVPFYPINDATNQQLYKRYEELSTNSHNVIFGGRLAEYKYYDMHQIVEKVLKYFDLTFNLSK